MQANWSGVTYGPEFHEAIYELGFPLLQAAVNPMDVDWLALRSGRPVADGVIEGLVARVHSLLPQAVLWWTGKTLHLAATVDGDADRSVWDEALRTTGSWTTADGSSVVCAVATALVDPPLVRLPPQGRRVGDPAELSRLGVADGRLASDDLEYWLQDDPARIARYAAGGKSGPETWGRSELHEPFDRLVAPLLADGWQRVHPDDFFFDAQWDGPLYSGYLARQRWFLNVQWEVRHDVVTLWPHSEDGPDPLLPDGLSYLVADGGHELVELQSTPETWPNPEPLARHVTQLLAQRQQQPRRRQAAWRMRHHQRDGRKLRWA